MLYLYGEATKRTPVPSLLQALLLHVYQTVADRAEVSVPALQGQSSYSRASELQVGGGGDAAAGHIEGGRS